MVYIFLADGFEDIEAIAPLDVMRRAGIEVRTAGVTGMSVTSANGLTVQADIPLDAVTLDGCEMLVLPGGSGGFVTLDKTQPVLELVKNADAAGIPVAAICGAPSILAKLGLLKNRRAVCYPSVEHILESNGARVQRDETVTHDRHIITAQAAGSSLDFAFKLVSMLRGWNAAEAVRKKMCYKIREKTLT
ncbi:MAG: DJ-1/PfpI family protein [Oscillospiraceae bacterium]|nr:DJ-1/PfpI family protein [Oscillospiraceae bacterium]